MKPGYSSQIFFGVITIMLLQLYLAGKTTGVIQIMVAGIFFTILTLINSIVESFYNK